MAVLKQSTERRLDHDDRGRHRIVKRVLRRLVGVRAASTVEYGIIVVAVMLFAAGGYKLLGGTLGKRSGSAGNTISGEESGGSSNGKAASQAAGGGGKGGGGGNAAASKMKVGGVGGGGATPTPDNDGRSRDTSSDTNPSGPGGAAAITGDTNITEGFGAKRWMGIGFLVMGVFAVGYVAMSMRRAKKGGDAAAGDGKTGAGKRKPA